MLNSHYKNIIQWTICYGQIPEDSDSITVAKKILDNLGVAFPNGNLDGIIQILKSKTYMGWNPCTREDAQRYANIGIATIAISPEKVIIIIPDKSIVNFSGDTNLQNAKNKYVMHSDDLSKEDIENALFFAYSYGYTFDD